MYQSKTLELLVGFFVALGIVALFFLAMNVSNVSEWSSGDTGYTISARFENTGSLKVRSPVSVAGVKVGRVTSIEFDKEAYVAVVEMRIDGQFDTFPLDTTASIFTQGLLGEQYVNLEPGGEMDVLKDGGRIQLTQSALVLEEIIGQFLFSKAEEGSE